MDANLFLLVASSPPVFDYATFPWLSLIVLLPAAAALVMPLLPGDGSDPRLPRGIALGVLSLDFALMLWVFSRHFEGGLSGLQLV